MFSCRWWGYGLRGEGGGEGLRGGGGGHWQTLWIRSCAVHRAANWLSPTIWLKATMECGCFRFLENSWLKGTIGKLHFFTFYLSNVISDLFTDICNWKNISCTFIADQDRRCNWQWTTLIGAFITLSAATIVKKNMFAFCVAISARPWWYVCLLRPATFWWLIRGGWSFCCGRNKQKPNL